MQRGYLKIVGCIILCLSLQSAFSQTSSFRLRTADSLFQAKRYTQSFEHYEIILSQNQYTPAMLLKMAYIQEGLLHTGQAMYYLNLYYLSTNDKTALEKMDELATKFNLEGYEPSESEGFLSFYRDYHLMISISLAALMILFLSIAFYTRTHLHRKPVVSFVFVIFCTLALASHFIFGEVQETGIITTPVTYVMSGPSAGANVVEIIDDGHRVELIGQSDVWMKIKWNGNTAYIKQNSIQPIQL